MMRPIVSVVMTNYNGERYLAEALGSILAQTLTEFEILLVDDASTDGSVAIAQATAAKDARLHIQCLTKNIGPAAARNHALIASRGKWIAIVDSDDFIHPERLQRLVAAAEAVQADIIADDQLIFDNNHRAAPRRLLCGDLLSAATWITPAQYVNANRLFARTASLGYLKPLIRASIMARDDILYTENMHIAEDYDLILRLLVRGARFRLLPELLYFYRRHESSISHRLSPDALQSMVLADERFRDWAGERAIAPLRTALDARLASIQTAAAVEGTIANLKKRRKLAAFSMLIRHPGAIPIIARLASPGSLAARMRRGKRPAIQAAPPKPSRPVICVLSRQRLTAGSSGSVAYLLSLCRTLRDNGFSLRLVCPSPSVLGRVPLLRVAGDGDVFDSVAIRGTRRIGGIFVARNPLVFLRAAIGVIDRIAQRIGITALAPLTKSAPYSVGLPWTAEDFLYVASEASGQADIVLADYGFLTPGIPYVLRPDATSVVIMHDLFSRRPVAFASIGSQDSVAALNEADEAGMLARADLVIAIQSEEAAKARRMLPHGHTVLVAPMAIEPVFAAQAGEGDGLLFVGSVTAANIDGIQWFLREVWPRIRAQLPDIRLTIAGTVCNRLGSMGRLPGVVLLGHVPELADLYRRADVVIAPLRVGSGLKIKLVEALAHGKSVVATTVAAQGLPHLLEDAVAIADTPQDFTAQILRLLAEPDLRAERAAAALAIARRSFSPSVAYADVVGHLLAQYPAVRTPTPCAA